LPGFKRKGVNSVKSALFPVRFCISIVVVASLLFPVCARSTLVVTAREGALQPYLGLGIHKHSTLYAADARDSIARLLIKDLGLNHARFFAWGENPGHMYENFHSQHGFPEPDGDTTNAHEDFLKYNPDMFFIAAFGGQKLLSDSAVKAVARKEAIFIDLLKKRDSLNICWTGLYNEPQDEGKGFIPVEHYPKMAAEMRRVLDSLGRDEVKIYGPEVSNVDKKCLTYVNSLIDDPQAWASIAGFQTKSYNMSANWEMREIVRTHNKPYFVAAGSNILYTGSNASRWYAIELGVLDMHYAANLAARMLNDFNHMCSYWAFYMGAEYYYHPENGHKLIWTWTRNYKDGSGKSSPFYFDGATAQVPTWESLPDHVDTTGTGNKQVYWIGDSTIVVITLKYYYYKHLSTLFDEGGKFRFCKADKQLPDYDMVYTFGQKPAINAAVLENPDKSWSAAVVNLTGCISDTLDSTDWHPKSYFSYYPADTYDVTLDIEELHGSGDLYFELMVTNKFDRLAIKDTVIVSDGKVTLAVPPQELYSIRSIASYNGISPQQKMRNLQAEFAYNPGVGFVVNAGKGGRYEIGIYAVNGRAVLQQREWVEAGEKLVMKTGALPSGVYIAKLKSGDMRGVKKRKFSIP
jgi:hypothetical protein